MEYIGNLGFYIPAAVLVLLFLMAAIKILREYERAVVFTLGRFTGVKGPGLILLIPIVQQMVRIDLRTLVPWDRDAVLDSVRRTRRCLIVHEDTMTAGFGSEIAAVLAREAFFDLDAPVERLAMPDVPSPHSPVLLEAVVPGVAQIARAVADLSAA